MAPPCNCRGTRVAKTPATLAMFNHTADLNPGDTVDITVRNRPYGTATVVEAYLTAQGEERVDVRTGRAVLTLRPTRGDTVTKTTAAAAHG